ncbi:hypothetical protein [Enterococcus phage Phi_Eg_SY1]|nr:hypothetical protein [Enterococcus phage Phi_Eg_SY1]
MIEGRFVSREWHKAAEWNWKQSGIVHMKPVKEATVIIRTKDIVTFSSEPYEFVESVR